MDGSARQTNSKLGSKASPRVGIYRFLITKPRGRPDRPVICLIDLTPDIIYVDTELRTTAGELVTILNMSDDG
jgi:hypothetical protein